MIAIASMTTAETKATVDYPESYRDWTHVKSMVIQEGNSLYGTFGGVHHIYANDTALAALKAGRTYPDGSVFVFDLLEATTKDNAIIEGKRKVLGVMQKNLKKFATTGGWGFEGFAGDSRDRVVENAATACYVCHTSQKGKNYVFSEYRK